MNDLHLAGIVLHLWCGGVEGPKLKALPTRKSVLKCCNEMGPNQVYSSLVERPLVSMMSHNIIWNLSLDQVNSVVL